MNITAIIASVMALISSALGGFADSLPIDTNLSSQIANIADWDDWDDDDWDDNDDWDD